MEDPFLLDQNRVESHLETVRRQLQRWRQLRDAEQVQGSGQEEQEEVEEEFHCLSGELARIVSSIRWDLDDLQETLQMMLDAKSPHVNTTADRDSRIAFVARSRSFLDEVTREVAMAAVKSGSSPGNFDKTGGASAANQVDDVETGDWRGPQKPLLTWRKDVDQVSFPSVELNSFMDLRKTRFHNRDWTGLLYRYRYILAMLAAICLIVFFTVVALAAKHTAVRRMEEASAAVVAAVEGPASTASTRPACHHPFHILC